MDKQIYIYNLIVFLICMITIGLVVNGNTCKELLSVFVVGVYIGTTGVYKK